MLKKFWMGALVAITASIAVPQTSEAGFKLQLQSGSSLATIDLNTLNNGLTAASTVGTVGAGQSGYSYISGFKKVSLGVTSVTFTQLQFAGYTITADTSVTNTPGTQKGGTLQLTNVSITRDEVAGNSPMSASDISLLLTATDYTLPVPQRTMKSSFTTHLDGTSENFATVTENTYYNSNNSEFGTGSGASFSSQASVGSGVGNTELGSGTSGYSITVGIKAANLNFEEPGFGNGVTNSSVSATVLAPAPSALLLCLLGIPAFGLLRRKIAASSHA